MTRFGTRVRNDCNVMDATDADDGDAAEDEDDMA
jgi:hypothetical protein